MLVVWAAIPPALNWLIGARNPVVRYRDHRLMAQAPVGAYKRSARTVDSGYKGPECAMRFSNELHSTGLVSTFYFLDSTF